MCLRKNSSFEINRDPCIQPKKILQSRTGSKQNLVSLFTQRVNSRQLKLGQRMHNKAADCVIRLSRVFLVLRLRILSRAIEDHSF